MEKHGNIYFQSILDIFIFYSIVMKVEKQEDSFCFSTSLGHMICFPHIHLLKTVRSVRAPPITFVFVPPPPPPHH